MHVRKEGVYFSALLLSFTKTGVLALDKRPRRSSVIAKISEESYESIYKNFHDPRASFQRSAHGIRPSLTCSGKSSVPTSASAVSYVFCADIAVVRARAVYACSLQPSLQQHSAIQSARVKVQSTKLGSPNATR